MSQKTLYRSTSDKKIAGLIGGLAEYFSADVNLLRLVFAVVVVFSGVVPGLVAYFIGALVVPEKPAKGVKNA